MTDHDRALALAECIAEAWAAALPTPPVDWETGRWRIVLNPFVEPAVVFDPTEEDYFIVFRLPASGASSAHASARARIQAADAATDGLIADRLRRSGRDAWLDWLYPREGGAAPGQAERNGDEPGA